jgi:hypothetical protein
MDPPNGSRRSRRRGRTRELGSGRGIFRRSRAWELLLGLRKRTVRRVLHIVSGATAWRRSTCTRPRSTAVSSSTFAGGVARAAGIPLTFSGCSSRLYHAARTEREAGRAEEAARLTAELPGSVPMILPYRCWPSSRSSRTGCRCPRRRYAHHSGRRSRWHPDRLAPESGAHGRRHLIPRAVLETPAIPGEPDGEGGARKTELLPCPSLRDITGRGVSHVLPPLSS